VRRTFINLVLVSGFLPIRVVVNLPLAADSYCLKARDLEERYLWKRAERHYIIAVRLNPFNTENIVDYAEFLLKTGKYKKDSIRINRAMLLLKKATELNPDYSEHWYVLAKAQKETEEGDYMASFRAAIEQDPYNFRINYLVGNELIRAWGSLNEEDKRFTLERMRHTLRLNSHYAKYIYPAILYHARDFSVAFDIVPDRIKDCKMLRHFIKKNKLLEFKEKIDIRIKEHEEREQGL